MILKYPKLIKIISIVTLLFFINGCLTIKIDKDSEPLPDFGSPIIGHFRNGDTVKGVIYTVLFAAGVIGLILFAPSSVDGKAIIPVERNVSDPVYFAFLTHTLNVPAVSAIDTATTYHLANAKILELNGLTFDPNGELTKYQVIMNHRELIREISAIEEQLGFEETYKNEIEHYKNALIDGTITPEEMSFLNNDERFRSLLINEIGYYNIKYRR